MKRLVCLDEYFVADDFIHRNPLLCKFFFCGGVWSGYHKLWPEPLIIVKFKDSSRIEYPNNSLAVNNTQNGGIIYCFGSLVSDLYAIGYSYMEEAVSITIK